MFSAGTLTLSNVIYAVPAAVEYEVLICLVSTPSTRGTRNTVNPPSVFHQLGPNVPRQATHFGTDGKVVRVHTTGNPFLGTVDDPALAIFRLGSGSPDTSHIGSSKCLGNGEGDDLEVSTAHRKEFRPVTF